MEQTPTFTIREVSEDEVELLIDGSLSGEPFDDFQKNLDMLIEKEHNEISLNLSGVKAMNSSNIARILLFQQKAKELGRVMRISGCSDSLYSLFTLTKVSDLINVEKPE